MKWLTTILCLLAFHATAQELPKNTVQIPSSMLCGVYNEGELMKKEYGEIPFVEGDAQVMSPDLGQAYLGDIRIFLNPETHSYTIMFDIDDRLSCLLTTGDKLSPIYSGKPL
jgi:hypothetical protein